MKFIRSLGVPPKALPKQMKNLRFSRQFFPGVALPGCEDFSFPGGRGCRNRRDAGGRWDTIFTAPDDVGNQASVWRIHLEKFEQRFL